MISIRLRAAMRSVRSLQRVRRGAGHVHGLRLKGAMSVGFRSHRPEVGRLRIEDQRAQPVLGLSDRRLRHDDGLFAARDFRFGLDDVDRRQRADLDARLRVAQRLLREVERLLRDDQRVQREHVVPVGVLHGRVVSATALLQADVGDLAVLARWQDLLAHGVELEVPQQRLGDLHVDVAVQLRVETAEDVVGRRARAVPRHDRVGAPREELRDLRVAAEVRCS